MIPKPSRIFSALDIRNTTTLTNKPTTRGINLLAVLLMKLTILMVDMMPTWPTKGQKMFVN